MIPLTRTRSDASIHSNFKTPIREAFESELMADQRSIAQEALDKHSFQSGRWKKAKDELKRDTNDKCAYCEAPTSVVAYGDVEHYRPKSKYWWLAYCYDNYLVSCQLCNQKYKKAKFSYKGNMLKCPCNIRTNTSDTYIRDRKGTLGPDPLDTINDVLNFEKAHLAERPYLINPYVDTPDQFYAWQVEHTLRRVKLIARPGLADAEKYIKAAEEDLGLNRIELQELRYQTLQFFEVLFNVLQDPGITQQTRAQIHQQMTRMIQDDAPFAGMVRFFSQHTHLIQNP